MSKKSIAMVVRASILMISAILLLSTFDSPFTYAAVTSTVGSLEGPYFQEIKFKIYATSQAEVAGLLTGDVDVVDFFEAEQIPDIQAGITDGSIKTAQAAEQGMWGWSIQCQRYPLNITVFRRAIAHLVDKNKIVTEGLQGLGYAIETFLGSPGYGPWAGTNYVTYDFNPTLAGQLLDSIGFVKGVDGWRIDPKTGTKMRELQIYARTEHPHRIFSGRELSAQMTAIGIPHKLLEVPRSVASPKVFVENDYDLYTAGWGGGPDVDWLYDLFHSTSPPQQNFHLFRNSSADAALEMLKFGSNYTTVLKGAQDAQRIISEQVPFIPLYAKAYISPYNARLNNVVNLYWRSGVTNWMTFFYARDKTTKYGGTLNVGWTSDPQQPSPLYEINWWWDGMLVDTIYEYLIDADPTTFVEIPWLAKSWNVETWTAPGNIPGLKITYNLVDNATWHNGAPLTADDVVFTWLYTQQQESPVYISYLLNLVNATAPNKTTAIAYLNTTSYWALHWLGENIPIIPKAIWQNVADSVHYQPIRDGNLIGSGSYRFKEYKPGEYVIIEANPNYWRRPKDSTLSYTRISLTLPGLLMAGDTKIFTQTAKIGTTPITNGTYTLKVLTSAGTLVKTVTGTVASDGTYSATLDPAGLAPGTYSLIEELKIPAAGTGLGSTNQYQLVTNEAPPNYALIVGIIVIAVVAISAGYIVFRRRKK